MRKAAIFYTSLSGNTADTAEIIAKMIRKLGLICDLYQTGSHIHLSDYDLVLYGSYTWGDGELPDSMQDELDQISNDIHLAALFGTGDTAFHSYCGAIHHMASLLALKNVPVYPDYLKVEQSPNGLNQIQKITKWTESLMKYLEEKHVIKNTLTHTKKSEPLHSYS